MIPQDHRAGPDQPDPSSIYVGLMSGTSLDGITAAAVRFQWSEHDGYPTGSDLVAWVTRPYEAPQRRRLERAIHEGASTSQWCQLQFDVGSWLADAALAVLAECGPSRAAVRAIGSHGQTVWHDPGHSTWQIGEPAVIGERTGLDVVSDFRVADVAAGGQGAPLVTIADATLYSPQRGWRALQNVGGIANVTIVPCRSDLIHVRAFDTGPGVILIDTVVRALRPDLPYDVDGQLARQGTPIPAVVSELLANPYFALPPPKSTGREHFSVNYAMELVARCRATDPSATDADVVATTVSLTARSIADAYTRFVPEPVEDVLLSGGGARNPALVDAISRALAPRPVRLFVSAYYEGDAKEAAAFALLAALYLRGRPGNVPLATGARGGRLLGKLSRTTRRHALPSTDPSREA